MSDYRNNPNNNTNYPQNTQRPGPSANRSPQARPVSSGVPVNRTVSNRPPVNRQNANRPSQNRPIQGRPSQNTSVPNSVTRNNSTKAEGMSTEGIGTEGSFGPASTQGKENPSGFKGINSTAESKYQEDSKSKMAKNSLSDLLDFTNMNSKDILKGIVLSEILGKPKALRRGRW